MEEYKNITISDLKFKENICNELLKGYKKIDNFMKMNFLMLLLYLLLSEKKFMI